MLIHHPAKFGVHMPCESGNITSFSYHVTTFLMCHVTCGWVSLILSHHPAKFRVHRPSESRNITPLTCQVTTSSMCHVTLWVGSSHPKSPLC